MTQEQAAELIDRLIAAFDKQLRPDTAAIYLEFLEKQPYETTRLAVDKCIEKERYFPTIATIRRYADEVTFEVQPDIYRPPWHRTSEGAFAEWRQRQLASMDDESYWQFLHDSDYRRRKEADWRTQWQRGMAKAI